MSLPRSLRRGIAGAAVTAALLGAGAGIAQATDSPTKPVVLPAPITSFRVAHGTGTVTAIDLPQHTITIRSKAAAHLPAWVPTYVATHTYALAPAAQVISAGARTAPSAALVGKTVRYFGVSWTGTPSISTLTVMTSKTALTR